VFVQYDYLAHALLGLGALHLSQSGNMDFTAEGLKHRVAAIKLINELMQQPAATVDDGDALFATLLILTTQTALLPDGMIEYLTILRGANLVVTQLMPDLKHSLFANFSAQGHLAAIESFASDEPKNTEDLALLEEFKSSVLMLEPLCKTHHEMSFLSSMLKIIALVPLSSAEGKLSSPANMSSVRRYANSGTCIKLGKNSHYS